MESDIGKFAYLDVWGDDEDRIRLGKLLDEKAAEDALFRPRRALLGGKWVRLALKGFREPAIRSSRPQDATGRTPVYFFQNYVTLGDSRRIVGAALDRRPWLFPHRREVAEVESAGAKYDAVARCWFLPPRVADTTDGKALLERMGASAAGTAADRSGRVAVFPLTAGERALVSEAGGHATGSGSNTLWTVPEMLARTNPKIARLGNGHTRREMHGHKRHGSVAPGAAADFQAYIDRADPEGCALDRQFEIARDDLGELVFSNVGTDPAERRNFWNALEGRDGRRKGAVLQFRQTAELPCELSPSQWRDIVERYIKFFADRGLPYSAVVHLPHVLNGADPRNVHLHLIFHDRPSCRINSDEWTFAPKKDREVRGPAFIAGCRDRWASICAEHQMERASPEVAEVVQLMPWLSGSPSRRFTAKGYLELGIPKRRGIHLGSKILSGERAGVPTELGRAHGRREESWRRYMDLQSACERTSRVADDAAFALGHALPSVGIALEQYMDTAGQVLPLVDEWVEKSGEHERRLGRAEQRITWSKRKLGNARSESERWRARQIRQECLNVIDEIENELATCGADSRNLERLRREMISGIGELLHRRRTLFDEIGSASDEIRSDDFDSRNAEATRRAIETASPDIAEARWLKPRLLIQVERAQTLLDHLERHLPGGIGQAELLSSTAIRRLRADLEALTAIVSSWTFQGRPEAMLIADWVRDELAHGHSGAVALPRPVWRSTIANLCEALAGDLRLCERLALEARGLAQPGWEIWSDLAAAAIGGQKQQVLIEAAERLRDSLPTITERETWVTWARGNANAVGAAHAWASLIEQLRTTPLGHGSEGAIEDYLAAAKEAESATLPPIPLWRQPALDLASKTGHAPPRELAAGLEDHRERPESARSRYTTITTLLASTFDAAEFVVGRFDEDSQRDPVEAVFSQFFESAWSEIDERDRVALDRMLPLFQEEVRSKQRDALVKDRATIDAEIASLKKRYGKNWSQTRLGRRGQERLTWIAQFMKSGLDGFGDSAGVRQCAHIFTLIEAAKHRRQEWRHVNSFSPALRDVLRPVVEKLAHRRAIVDEATVRAGLTSFDERASMILSRGRLGGLLRRSVIFDVSGSIDLFEAARLARLAGQQRLANVYETVGSFDRSRTIGAAELYRDLRDLDVTEDEVRSILVSPEGGYRVIVDLERKTSLLTPLDLLFRKAVSSLEPQEHGSTLTRPPHHLTRDEFLLQADRWVRFSEGEYQLVDRTGTVHMSIPGQQVAQNGGKGGDDGRVDADRTGAMVLHWRLVSSALASGCHVPERVISSYTSYHRDWGQKLRALSSLRVVDDPRRKALGFRRPSSPMMPSSRANPFAAKLADDAAHSTSKHGGPPDTDQVPWRFDPETRVSLAQRSNGEIVAIATDCFGQHVMTMKDRTAMPIGTFASERDAFAAADLYWKGIAKAEDIKAACATERVSGQPTSLSLGAEGALPVWRRPVLGDWLVMAPVADGWTMVASADDAKTAQMAAEELGVVPAPWLASHEWGEEPQKARENNLAASEAIRDVESVPLDRLASESFAEDRRAHAQVRLRRLANEIQRLEKITDRVWLEVPKNRMQEAVDLGASVDTVSRHIYISPELDYERRQALLSRFDRYDDIIARRDWFDVPAYRTDEAIQHGLTFDRLVKRWYSEQDCKPKGALAEFPALDRSAIRRLLHPQGEPSPAERFATPDVVTVENTRTFRRNVREMLDRQKLERSRQTEVPTNPERTPQKDQRSAPALFTTSLSALSLSLLRPQPTETPVNLPVQDSPVQPTRSHSDDAPVRNEPTQGEPERPRNPSGQNQSVRKPTRRNRDYER